MNCKALAVCTAKHTVATEGSKSYTFPSGLILNELSKVSHSAK